MMIPITFVLRQGYLRISRHACLAACLVAGWAAVVPTANGQVFVYEPVRPVVSYYAPMAAGFPGGYVANYSPAGNYAAVTAFSPPIGGAYVANYVAAEPVVSAPVAVTSYYAPAPVMPAPVVAAPVTPYYAPAGVAVPLYRRGPFGGLRPVRSAMFLPY